MTQRVVRGWEVHRLTAGTVEVDVVPGMGGDILAVRRAGTDLLWRSPWGLRQRGSVTTHGASAAGLIEAYPGGWQTVFPNGGDACEEHGVEWGMHGEAWLAAWDVDDVGPDRIAMSTRLVRSPFRLRKMVRVDPGGVAVEESVRNEGGEPIEVMWSHHPAFGEPLLGPGVRISTSATTFVSDAGELTRHRWPLADGVDLAGLPPEGAAEARFGYLTDFEGDAWVEVVNPQNGLMVRLTWDAGVMPHAWYWLEWNATPGFPWFRAVRVLGLEPATSWPGRGIAHVRATTGNQVRIGPGEERATRIRLDVGADGVS